MKTSILSVLLAATVCTLVGGCSSTYSVDVRNQTPQVLFVQVATQRGAQTETLGLRRLGPGDRGGLGPFTVAPSAVVLTSVDTTPNPGRAPELILRPGLSVLEVFQEGNQSAGPLRLREVGASAP